MSLFPTCVSGMIWHDSEGLTKMTFDALILTTHSMVACIRYLQDFGFRFVLPCKFSSDASEETFGMLRMMLGGNHRGDALSAIRAIEKVLRTGIARYQNLDGNTHPTKDDLKTSEMIHGAEKVSTSSAGRASSLLSTLPDDLTGILDALQLPAGKCLIVAKGFATHD